MSYMPCRDGDLRIRPLSLEFGSAWIPPKPPPRRRGALEEASWAGMVALALSWGAAELAFLVWG